MKRRIIMGIAAVTAVFATENIVDTLVTRYIRLELEILTWIIVAIIAAIAVYYVGDERGDW